MNHKSINVELRERVRINGSRNTCKQRADVITNSSNSEVQSLGRSEIVKYLELNQVATKQQEFALNMMSVFDNTFYIKADSFTKGTKSYHSKRTNK